MRRFSLRTLIVACLLAGGLIGFYRKPIANFLGLNRSKPPIQIESAEQMDLALTSSSAIIFAHVDWSSTSFLARKNFADFVLHWTENGNRHIDFFFLDLTDAQQNAPTHVQQWLASDIRLSGLPIRGSGDVVWLKNGKFRKWITAYNLTPDDLENETKTIFSQ